MMTPQKKIAVGLGIAAVIAVALSLYFVKGRKVSFVSPHDKVVDIVKEWARLSSRPKDEDLLEPMWAASGPSFEFFPYGAQDLEKRLLTAFPESKKPVIQYRNLYAAKNPGAKVKTVFDLAELVRYNYDSQ